MKTGIFALFTLALVLAASVALAAPGTITMANISSAGQTNYPATCSIVGVLDNTDKLHDNTERINLASLRTLALTKGGQKNYSTALNTKGSQFRISCVRTADGVEHPVKMFFDNISTYWMRVFTGIYRFY